MAKQAGEQIFGLIEEHISRLRRDISNQLLGGSPLADEPCGCFHDKGCCTDKGCCSDKGCCTDKKSRPEDWVELVDFSEMLGIPVAQLIERIKKLDPQLLGVKG